MQPAVATTKLEAWTRLVAQCPDQSAAEYRRKHERRDTLIGMAELAEIRPGRPPVRRAKVLNVSEDGVLLRVREWLAEGTDVVMQVTLDRGEALLVGRVVHCTATVGGFKVGIELQFESAGG